MRILGIVGGVVLVALLVLVYSATYTVHQTQQAIVLQFGNPVRITSNPGLHFKMPFVQNVDYFEKRILSLDAQPTEYITQDQKRLVVDVFTRYRISDPLAFFKAYRFVPAAETRLEGIVSDELRDLIGNSAFTSLLTEERATIMRTLSGAVSGKMAPNGIEVVDVRIKRADLPEQNKDAIFQRMRTEREREAKEERALGDEEARRVTARADRDKTVLIAEAKKTSEILRGEGDGARAKIFNEVADDNPDFYAFYRSLQAYREALNSSDTTLVLNPNSDFFQFFGNIKPAANSR